MGDQPNPSPENLFTTLKPEINGPASPLSTRPYLTPTSKPSTPPSRLEALRARNEEIRRSSAKKLAASKLLFRSGSSPTEASDVALSSASSINEFGSSDDKHLHVRHDSKENGNYSTPPPPAASSSFPEVATSSAPDISSSSFPQHQKPEVTGDGDRLKQDLDETLNVLQSTLQKSRVGMADAPEITACLIRDLEAANEALGKQAKAFLERQEFISSAGRHSSSIYATVTAQDDPPLLTSLSSDSNCQVPPAPVHDLHDDGQWSQRLVSLVDRLHANVRDLEIDPYAPPDPDRHDDKLLESRQWKKKIAKLVEELYANVRKLETSKKKLEQPLQDKDIHTEAQRQNKASLALSKELEASACRESALTLALKLCKKRLQAAETSVKKQTAAEKDPADDRDDVNEHLRDQLVLLADSNDKLMLHNIMLEAANTRYQFRLADSREKNTELAKLVQTLEPQIESLEDRTDAYKDLLELFDSADAYQDMSACYSTLVVDARALQSSNEGMQDQTDEIRDCLFRQSSEEDAKITHEVKVSQLQCGRDALRDVLHRVPGGMQVIDTSSRRCFGLSRYVEQPTMRLDATEEGAEVFRDQLPLYSGNAVIFFVTDQCSRSASTETVHCRLLSSEHDMEALQDELQLCRSFLEIHCKPPGASLMTCDLGMPRFFQRQDFVLSDVVFVGDVYDDVDDRSCLFDTGTQSLVNCIDDLDELVDVLYLGRDAQEALGVHVADMLSRAHSKQQRVEQLTSQLVALRHNESEAKSHVEQLVESLGGVQQDICDTRCHTIDLNSSKVVALETSLEALRVENNELKIEARKNQSREMSMSDQMAANESLADDARYIIQNLTNCKNTIQQDRHIVSCMSTELYNSLHRESELRQELAGCYDRLGKIHDMEEVPAFNKLQNRKSVESPPNASAPKANRSTQPLKRKHASNGSDQDSSLLDRYDAMKEKVVELASVLAEMTKLNQTLSSRISVLELELELEKDEKRTVVSEQMSSRSLEQVQSGSINMAMVRLAKVTSEKLSLEGAAEEMHIELGLMQKEVRKCKAQSRSIEAEKRVLLQKHVQLEAEHKRLKEGGAKILPRSKEAPTRKLINGVAKSNIDNYHDVEKELQEERRCTSVLKDLVGKLNVMNDSLQDENRKLNENNRFLQAHNKNFSQNLANIQGLPVSSKDGEDKRTSLNLLAECRFLRSQKAGFVGSIRSLQDQLEAVVREKETYEMREVEDVKKLNALNMENKQMQAAMRRIEVKTEKVLEASANRTKWLDKKLAVAQNSIALMASKANRVIEAHDSEMKKWTEREALLGDRIDSLQTSVLTLERSLDAVRAEKEQTADRLNLEIVALARRNSSLLQEKGAFESQKSLLEVELQKQQIVLEEQSKILKSYSDREDKLGKDVKGFWGW